MQGLYFYRSDMPFNTKLIGILDRLEQAYTSIYFYAIDTDQFSGTCIRFAVSSVPTLVILKGAEEVGRILDSVQTQHFIDIFRDIYSVHS